MTSLAPQTALHPVEPSFFDPEREMVVARAPGRLDLMGGNVDYTGGLVLQTLVQEGIQITSQMRRDERIILRNPGATQYGWQPDVEFALSDLDDAEHLRRMCHATPGLQWIAYVAGSLHLLRSRGRGLSRAGVQIYVESDLPPNKGVSSSAALAIATLKSVSTACGSPLMGTELAEAGQWVENEIARSACGIMDHAAIVFGQQRSLLPMLCQPLQIDARIPLPAGVRLWGVDSTVPRTTTSVAYERARAAAFMAYKLLCDRENLAVSFDGLGAVPRWRDARWNGYLSAISPEDFESRYERELPEALTGDSFLREYGPHVDPFTSIHPQMVYPVRAAAQYAVREHERVQHFASLFSSNPVMSEEQRLCQLGELMFQSHQAYGTTGLGSDRCDELVEMVRRAGSASGLYGAKMTGGGGGGTVAILGTDRGEETFRRIVEDYGRRYGVTPYVFAGNASEADTFDHQILPQRIQQAV
ncbi:galactokinase family protein [Terriglobus sp. TAA 43]|uniref:GHMP family kinase ATP-binding protein n=1 Tax=Terriglobus sp. TAA 43 TaxID=278961 RepID=UPI00068EBDAB|nr:galactokinase family protein [Terriglobus sp. TAA 43]